jgi:putative intracellular protease/amidase
MTEMPFIPRFVILIVEDEGERPDVGLPWIAPAYYAFIDMGVEVAIATPLGGPPILATLRATPDESPAVERFKADRNARDELADTLSLDQIVVEDFDAAFCIGFSGRIWVDEDRAVAAFVRAFLSVGKPVALVPGRYSLVAPEGAGAGLLILGDSEASPLQAARALVHLVCEMHAAPDIQRL